MRSQRSITQTSNALIIKLDSKLFLNYTTLEKTIGEFLGAIVHECYIDLSI